MERSAELESKIREYSQAYYAGEAVITDAQFDALVDELRSLNPNSPVLTKTGWGYEFAGDKVKHPLVSIKGLPKQKVQTSDIIPFTVATPKFDGANAELIYVNGVFDKAISRGDGEYGQDITRHLKPIIPPRLSTNPLPSAYKFIDHCAISISGEFCLSRESKEQFYQNEMAFRNIPAGFLNRNESTEEECQRFAFQPYRINAIRSVKRIEDGVLESLQDRSTVQAIVNSLFGYSIPFVSQEDFQSEKPSYQAIMDIFNEYGFYYDGIVAITGNVNILRSEEAGQFLYRFEYPELAYKVTTDYSDVVIDHIDWNLTRTGKLVPVANFEGTELSGAVVRRATLHNAYVVEANELHPGSVIRVTRSGEVIPYVMGVVKEGVYQDLQ